VARDGRSRYPEGVTRDAPDDEVPKLPRGRGLRLSRPQMVRIAGTLLLLVFLIVVQRPCADAVSKLVTSFGGGQGSASAQMPRPGTVDMPGSGSAAGSAGSAASTDRYEHLRPGMTDDEIKAVIDRARLKAAGSAAP
jgi:hypothetical protein